jgi:hypothetical protein
MPSLARASYVLATWLNKEYWLDEPDKQPARPRQSALSAKRGDATRYLCQPLRECIFWTTDGEWGNTDEGRHILIAVVRYLAAHSPTERAELQTADIARRLMRGGELHRIPQPERWTALLT